MSIEKANTDTLMRELESLRQERERLLNAIPSVCPITQAPFFSLIEHPDRGWVATYGGPFDSYTIPELHPEKGKPIHEWALIRQRFDHDKGAWSGEHEAVDIRLIDEGDLVDLQFEARETGGWSQGTEDNARRLMALWNACRGISTKQLEIVASYESDEARLSWLGWSADMVSRGKEPTP